MPGTFHKQKLSSVEEALRASIGAGNIPVDDLSGKLARQSRNILLQKIDFIPSSGEASTYWNSVASKYSCQNTMNTDSQAATVNGICRKSKCILFKLTPHCIVRIRYF